MAVRTKSGPAKYDQILTVYIQTTTHCFTPLVSYPHYDNAEVNWEDLYRYIHGVKTLHPHCPFEPTRCTGHRDLNFSVCVNRFNVLYYIRQCVLIITLKEKLYGEVAVFLLHLSKFPLLLFNCGDLGFFGGWVSTPKTRLNRDYIRRMQKNNKIECRKRQREREGTEEGRYTGKPLCVVKNIGRE